jgi:hypothetical protein
LGLKTKYEQDSEFAHEANTIAALTFLKTKQVNEGFGYLFEASPSSIHPRLDYFEDIYVGRRRDRRRVTPMFSVDLWIMHQRATDFSMRTKNSSEGSRRRLGSMIPSQHLNLWSFIESLQSEEYYTHCQLIKLQAGEKKTSKQEIPRLQYAAPQFNYTTTPDAPRAIR